MAEKTSEMQMFELRLWGRAIVAGVGLIVLAIVSYYLFQAKCEPGSASWFVALLVIVLTALTTTAAVFSGLKLGNPEEAFGLPSGSIRALLAVGLMTLLVVFGLRAMQADATAPLTMADKPFTSIQVAAEKVSDVTPVYANLGFIVIVTDPGATAGPKGPKGASGAPAKPAKLDLYNQVHAQGTNDANMSKQLVTAIVTLMTTVIGFYFGSRSATDGVKAAEGAAGGSAAPTDLVLDRKTAGETFSDINKPVQAAEQQLARIRGLPALPNGDDEKQRVDLQQRAQASLDTMSNARKSVEGALATADSALDILSHDPSADVARVQIEIARKAIDAAKAGLETFRGVATAFTQAIDALVKATAEG